MKRNLIVTAVFLTAIAAAAPAQAGFFKPRSPTTTTSTTGGTTTTSTTGGSTSVPEPGMLGLFGMGLVGIGLSRRRRAHG